MKNASFQRTSMIQRQALTLAEGKISLPALASAVLATVAALAVVFVMNGCPPRCDCDLTWEVAWEEDYGVNSQSSPKPFTSQITHWDDGYVYVTASLAQLGIDELEAAVGAPIFRPNIAGGLVAYEIRCVPQEGCGLPEPCVRIRWESGNQCELQFPRGTLRCTGSRPSPGTWSSAFRADPDGIVALSKRKSVGSG
jgi:hypothetical protein